MDAEDSILRAATETAAHAGVIGLAAGAIRSLRIAEVPLGVGVLAGAIQWSGGAFLFTGARKTLIRASDAKPGSGAEYASTAISASLIGALLRVINTGDRRGVASALLLWGSIGLTSQYVVERSSLRATDQPHDRPRMVDRLLGSRFSPFKRLSDAEYIAVLEGQARRLEISVASADEEIALLEAEEANELVKELE